MGEQTQQPAGLGKLFFCPVEEFERLGMAAPMQEVHLAEPSRLSPGMLTYEDGSDGKPKGGWPANISFHATAKIEPDEVLQQLLQKEQADDLRKLIERLTISRRERKKMLHAVTHGQAIMFVGNIAIDGGETTQIPVCIDRPSVLRKFFRALRGARFQYAIVPLNCCDKYPRLKL